MIANVNSNMQNQKARIFRICLALISFVRMKRESYYLIIRVNEILVGNTLLHARQLPFNIFLLHCHNHIFKKLYSVEIS